MQTSCLRNREIKACPYLLPTRAKLAASRGERVLRAKMRRLGGDDYSDVSSAIPVHARLWFGGPRTLGGKFDFDHVLNRL